jgi:SAM-dependent methyltransferase
MRRSTSFGQRGLSGLDPFLFAARTRRVIAHLPPTARVVADLGCGFDARLLRQLDAEGRLDQGIGIDLAVGPVPSDSRLTTIAADLNEPLPIPDHVADAAVSLAVLEHLTEPRGHLAELHRILRPNGVLLLTTPTARAKPVLEFIAYRLHLIDAEEIRDHKHYFSGPELNALVVDAGFDRSRVSWRQFSFGFNQLLVAQKRG